MFCVIAASCLWVYIASGQSAVGKFPGSIKIKAINIPAGLTAIYDNTFVDIKIMAEPSVWKKLSADSFSAYIDLKAMSEGTYEVNVNVVSSESGVQIVEKTPDKIYVRIEPVVSKEVNIEKKIDGNAGEGLVAGNIEFSPEKAIVRGPKSYVNNLVSATALIHLNEESSDFEKKVTLFAYNDEGQVIKEVEFTPQEVSAKVSLIRASNNKSVGIKVNTKGTPMTGFYVSEISVVPDIIDITGPKNLTSPISYLETEPIDISDLSSDVEKDILLKIPDGVALQANSPQKIKVKAKLAKVETMREISASYLPKNLVGYSVSSYSPSQAKVVVSGPLNSINALKSSDVSIILDFQGKSLGNMVTFDLLPSIIKVPDGIDVVGVLPTIVNVSLAR